MGGEAAIFCRHSRLLSDSAFFNPVITSNPPTNPVSSKCKGRIFLAAEEIRQPWQMKRTCLSPANTIRISDSPKVT
ncbi:DUF4113 domain-containing protein [Oceanisphaera ostreae]|uniref:DUF4113 domain-containing protein n=1 Tax=Oceanisphaera ostreae TaxID=914151 RepID=A0ABW3KK56_9GAMM